MFINFKYSIYLYKAFILYFQSGKRAIQHEKSDKNSERKKQMHVLFLIINIINSFSSDYKNIPGFIFEAGSNILASIEFGSLTRVWRVVSNLVPPTSRLIMSSRDIFMALSRSLLDISSLGSAIIV